MCKILRIALSGYAWIPPKLLIGKRDRLWEEGKKLLWWTSGNEILTEAWKTAVALGSSWSQFGA